MFKMTLGIPQAGNLSSNCMICNLVHSLQQQQQQYQRLVYTGGPAKSLGMHDTIKSSPSTKTFTSDTSTLMENQNVNDYKVFTD